MNVRRLLYFVGVLAVAVSARDLHAQTDVIRGKVIGPDSVPIPGVTVTATTLSGNVSRNTKTDKKGAFSISFPNGDGDYIVSFAAMGFAAKRFEVKRTADQEFLVADAKLTRSAVQLDAMKVQQARNRPNRGDAGSSDISGTERGLGGGILGADQMGDLAAMAAALPGFSYVPATADGPAGFSVFGLDQTQNLTTLNGMPFGGDGVPRDAGVSSSVSTSPYDVSRGGFSGGSVTLRTSSGNNFLRRRLSFQGMAPQATWTDATGRAAGAANTYGSVGGSFSGPIRFNKAFYNTSFQFNNTTKDLLALTSGDPNALATAGVAPDSVTRALNLFGVGNIPLTTPRVPNEILTRSGSLLGAFDFTPPTSNTGAAYNVSFNGSFNKSTPTFQNPLDLPSRGADRNDWTGGIQARHNAYFGFGVLTETSIGASANGSQTNPYLRLPSGSVRVSSDLGGSAPVVRSLGFGGNQGRATSNTLNQSFFNTLSWFTSNNKHRIKMTTELNYSHNSSSQFNNEFGSFSYQSLVDFQNNVPSSYTRQLTPRQTSIGNLVGGWSLGDSYRPNQDLQIQYGVRLDGNHFTTLPTHNAAIETVFARDNASVPTPVYLSPRIGFTKTLGTVPEVVAFDGAFRAPRMVVSGGVGVFQNAPNTNALGQAIAGNGLPTGIQQLTCIGTATPIADWDAYMIDPMSAPTVCANGVGASEFATSAPNVNLFATNYESPRSLRSNLSWRGYPFGGRFSTSINGIVSYNQHQAGNFDLNFNPDEQFTLGEEAGRPVYVKTTSIVPSTGLVSSRDAKVSTSFNRVNEIRSDLNSHSEQLQINVSPFNWSYSWRWSLGYTIQNTKDQQRGFSNTAGDPRDVSWGRSFSDSRHDIRYSLSYLFFGAVNVSWNQSFRSGTPFTPMVSGDVNGDGYFNDRAFVFDPATVADPAVKAGIQALLDNGPDAARECLKSQLGTLATRGSCQGPWTSNASLSLRLDPTRLRLPHRMGLNLSISNPLSAADMILHGEDKLHGWGQTPSPDASLLAVRAFDPSSKRYTYEVNSRFGSTSLQQTLSRSPVRLQLGVSLDVGPTIERQVLTQSLDRGRGMLGVKGTEATWKAQYSRGPVLNPLAQVLTSADSMQLTRVQADSIAALNRWYTIRLDSIWTPIAKYFADLPDEYDQGEAYARYRQGREASVDLLIKVAPIVKSMLTPAQSRKLGFIAQFLDTRYLSYVRSGSASGGGMAMGDIPLGAAVSVVGGGGGGPIIIR